VNHDLVGDDWTPSGPWQPEHEDADWLLEQRLARHSPDALLDDVERFLGRFIAFPSVDARVAVTLWTAHAHVVDAFDSTPRLAVLSPEPGSGKSRVLEVLELLVPEPLHALSASSAAVFRSIESEDRPTLLFDEVDTIFGRTGRGDDNEDLRGLLNAGHRQGAVVPRCVGPRHEVHRFPVFAAAALAGLGDLPETLMTRSVVVRMRPRLPSETIRPFRHRVEHDEGDGLRRRLTGWANGVGEHLGDAWPAMPDGIEDRPADVWEPLLAIADAVGGDWPTRARAACVALASAAVTQAASLGRQLLSDLRLVFRDEDRLSTEAILTALHKLDEAPWADLRGRPLDARGLANRLRRYEVTPTKVKVDGVALRGYRREDLYDAWQRYCPSDTPADAEPPEPPEPPRSQHRVEVPDRLDLVEPPAPGGHQVPEPPPLPEPETPPLTSEVPEVPQVPDLRTPERRLLGPMPPYPGADSPARKQKENDR
jgi:hypothetical protein